MNTTLSPAATYVDAVRTALADLPADDLAEIVEDVRDHVEQVSAELGAEATAAALEERLGTPAVYAAELRSAAGYPPGPGDVGPAVRPPRVRRQVATWIVRIAVVLTLIALLEAFVTGRYGGALALAIVAWLAAALVGLVWLMAERSTGTMGARLGELPDARRMNGLIRWLRGNSVGAALVETIIALRPAWWIARAWIAVELVGMFFSAQWFPLPTFTGAPLVFALAVVISVWLGRRASSHRQTSGEHVLVLLGNVVAVLGLAAVIGTLASRGVLGNDDEVYREDASFLGAVPTGAFHEDGTQITNLYPYGADGRLLENVRLYDQDGRPFTSVKYDGCMFDSMMGEPKLAAPLNVYPRPSSSYGGALRGECTDLGIVPPFGATLPGTSSDATPTPSASVSPQPSPTSTPTAAPGS